MFDRMILKDHISALYKQDGARCFLWSEDVALDRPWLLAEECRLR